jgi:hypothetical protein
VSLTGLKQDLIGRGGMLEYERDGNAEILQKVIFIRVMSE